jgi:squalene-hopene/tetraprenyl-beta-curcumene cyclase
MHKENFANYVKQLPFNQSIKNSLIERCNTDKNPEFYLAYAALFKNSFEFENSEEKIKLLNIAGYFCYNYSLFLDAALDEEAKHTNLMLANIYLEEAIKILTSLFGLDKQFWSLWNARKQEVFEASKIGKHKFNSPIVLMKEYETLCDSKSALGKIALDSLFILSGKAAKSNYEKLMESHKYFSVGFQINDDIEDFIEDYKNKDFNFAYYTFTESGGNKSDDIINSKKRFYISDSATNLYKLSLTYFQKALEIAKEVEENTWQEIVEGKIKETEAVITSIDEFLTITKTKVSIIQKAVAVNSFKYSFNENSSVEKGINYIIKEWEKDYPEVKHVMVLSSREDFNNKTVVHVTDIFQRGIVTNNFIAIGKDYKMDLSKIILHEINYLVQNRNKEGVGCWSYFPTVKEIAPDADDLGQMMQVFIKTGNKDIVKQYCDTGIKILIEDCYNKHTGGIETWIIPKNNPSENQKLQKKFNDTKWGSGPDIDVMANFLYALCLEDYERYKSIIENGTDYIYKKAEEGCFWNSRWYYGWQYGTMLCVRLCLELLKQNSALSNTYSTVLNNVRSYIIKTQQDDGGWAVSSTAKSDPLNTSLALSTLMLFSETNKNIEALKRGIHFLENSQNLEGSWDAISFIKPKLNEPYKSKVITTSYALHALTTYYSTNFSY